MARKTKADFLQMYLVLISNHHVKFKQIRWNLAVCFLAFLGVSKLINALKDSLSFQTINSKGSLI